MRRVSVCFGVVAMFWALLTAPLFHFHDRDDHGHPTSLVHAHWLESTEPSHSAHAIEDHGDQVEGDGDHHRARFIDFYTFNWSFLAFPVTLELMEDVAVPLLEERGAVVNAELPRAHAPPEHNLSIPRSPPTT